MSGTLYLLGPQRPQPNLGEILAQIPGTGPVVTISAGWRHDEAHDDALREVVGSSAVRLPLYQWFEDLRAPELREAHRLRQEKIVSLKEIYRTRLHSQLQVVRRLLEGHASAPAEVSRPQVRWALDDLQRIDRQFLDQSQALVDAHPDARRPWQEEEVRPFHRQASDLLLSARAILVAGGHVGVLRNRMQFFGIHRLLAAALNRGTAVVAWSAGLMALTERVVLFYDDPPEGSSHPEIFDHGFGLVPGLVALPHARRRLRLEDSRRVSLLATRFGPAACIGLENGAWIERSGSRWVNRGQPDSALHLLPDGRVVPLEGP